MSPQLDDRQSSVIGVTHVLPISRLRFVLAILGVVGHYGLPIFHGVAKGRLWWVVRALFNNSINGPAAVIIFFVISGFCIHFPNRQGVRMLEDVLRSAVSPHFVPDDGCASS